MSLDWYWKRKDWGGATGMAYSRLFNGKGSTEDVIAREVIQNSWDAAGRHRTTHGRTIKDSKFEIRFDFNEFVQEQKKKMCSALRLNELRERLQEVGHERLALEHGNTILDNILTPAPLRVMYIHDYGATGLRGRPSEDNLDASDFFRAFGELGGNDRSVGGGSFGFGKSAFIRSSKIRMVVAYSSFFKEKDDRITRRLWGFLYWQTHARYSGVALLGLNVEGELNKSQPAEDELADSLAEQMGFPVRNAHSYEACGTSLMVVDHAVDPIRLNESIERNWWPAIREHGLGFDVSIVTDMDIIKPKPYENEWCKPFLRAYDLANGNGAPVAEGNEFFRDWRNIRDLDFPAGRLGLVHVEGSHEDLTHNGSYSHVALIRSPRMVVQYQPQSGATLNNAVKGVFVASEEADQYLRKSEPMTHDEWTSQVDATYGPDWEIVKRVATSIENKIRTSVQEFQKSLRPIRENQTVSSSIADEILARIFSRPRGGSQGERSKRKRKGILRSTNQYISTRIERTPKMDSEGWLIEETWKVELPENVSDPRKFQLAWIVKVLVDGHEANRDHLVKYSAWVDGKEIRLNKEGVFGISLLPESSRTIRFRTEKIDHDWTIDTDLEIKVVSS